MALVALMVLVFVPVLVFVLALSVLVVALLGGRRTGGGWLRDRRLGRR
jgi:hypothetical protein